MARFRTERLVALRLLSGTLGVVEFVNRSACRDSQRLAGGAIDHPPAARGARLRGIQLENRRATVRCSEDTKCLVATCGHNVGELPGEVNELDGAVCGVVFEKECGRSFALFRKNPENSFAVLRETSQTQRQASAVVVVRGKKIDDNRRVTRGTGEEELVLRITQVRVLTSIVGGGNLEDRNCPGWTARRLCFGLGDVGAIVDTLRGCLL
jgi:hypothetical protein